MPNPQTPIYGLPYEDSADEPGETLDGGSAGTRPILARAVEAELARIDGDVGSNQTAIAVIQARLDALEAGTTQPGWTPIQNGTAVSAGTIDVDLTDGGRFVAGEFELVRLFMRYDLDATGTIGCRINNESSAIYNTGTRQLDAANPAGDLTAFPITQAGLGIDDLGFTTATSSWRIGQGATVSTNVLETTFFHMNANNFHSYISKSTRMSTSGTTHAIADHWGNLISAAAAVPSSLRLFLGSGATIFTQAWWWAEGYRLP